MLFDLRGRRRRAVQATYLILAVLMGGGLVLFGIGGGVSGGLLDAITGGGGGSDANSQLEKQIDREEKRLATSPNNPAVLKALVRDHYALAASDQPSGSSQFPDDAKDDLRAAGRYWQRYLAVEKGTPDASLATFALQVYDTGALNQPKEAARAMAIIAERQNTFQAYLALVQRATAAGDTRTADLAAQKAVDLAPKNQKRQVKKLAEQAKKQTAAAGPQQ
jgi:hypothetical protein